MKLIKICLTFIVSVLLSIILIHGLTYPTLLEYPRIAHTMARFTYTQETLIVFFTLTLWLFCVQVIYRKISIIYLYLVYSIYLFLLFVVLFTKAEHYHDFILTPFDFLVWDKRVIFEAILNIIYFIPLGMLYGLKANFKEFTIIALLTLLGIETIQYLFYVGTFGTSDIMLNFIGCLIGYKLCLFFKNYFNSVF